MVRSKITRALVEADDMNQRQGFDARKANIGQVKFRKSSLNDPIYQKLLNDVMSATKAPPELVYQSLMKAIQGNKEMLEKAPLCMGTMIQNEAETFIFKVMTEHAKEENGYKNLLEFSPKIFMDLLELVQFQNKRFFPLTKPGEVRSILQIRPIFLPSEDPVIQRHYGMIDTAAATPDGKFLFNIPFMQKLLNYGSMIDLKPSGKKYQCNGGPIPNPYAYIETLIVHELLHYSFDDFSLSKTMGQYASKIHNYATDYRSNYMLVKAGYEQLPMGLFSDFVNYDRQKSYSELVAIVKREIDALSQDDRKKVMDEMDNALDDHDVSDHDNPNPQPSNSGKTPDEIQKEVEGKLGKSNDDTIVDPAEAKERNAKDRARWKAQNAQNGGGHGDQLGDFSDISHEINRVNPSKNWKELLRTMVVSSKPKPPDQTYLRPNARSATGVHIATQVGKSALKPGEIQNDDGYIRLALCLDTSGSMGASIPIILAEVLRLVKFSQVSQLPIFVAFFADQPIWYMINVKDNKWAEVDVSNMVGTMPKKVMWKPNYKHVLTHATSGGTNFASSMADGLIQLAAHNFNILVCSDSDITYGGNLSNFKRLFSAAKSKLYFLAADRNQFQTVAKSFDNKIPPTWSHL